jgi:hypothetical protein
VGEFGSNASAFSGDRKRRRRTVANTSALQAGRRPRVQDAKEIALYRSLRGFGSQDAGFLDFAIALEATLLEGEKTELAYRFRLYGALFLNPERDPDETFEKLKNIYDVRSSLVHGSRLKVEKRSAAERDAADLAGLITKKAIESGWPSGKALDQLALEHGKSGSRNR